MANSKKRKTGKKVSVPSHHACISTTKAKGKKRKHQHTSLNEQHSKPSSSLAQLLKKHRGIAAKTDPPPLWKNGIGSGKHQRDFLTPQDDDLQSFNDCLKTSYSGFYFDAPDSLPTSLHRHFDSSFSGIEQGGLFLYDVVQPGKKKLTRTSVTRTLVGDPGSTYKYLGLRLFSHPWVDIRETGDKANSKDANNGSTLRKLGYNSKTTSALISMGLVNSNLTERSKSMLKTHVSPHVSPVGMVGSADFNLTLVNKMEPTTEKKDLKVMKDYGMGKISVGWHRDSGLKDFSTIAVYQSLKGPPPSNTNDSWGVAVRAMDGGAGGPLTSVPPLVVPLPSGSLYYMLDDFNHNHEHAVIAGSSGTRYSSTHRVAREGQGTWQYIRGKIQSFSSAMAAFNLDKGIVPDSTLSLRNKRSKLVSHIRVQQNLMTEIEFEWLRQWYVQGQKNAALHPYWHSPMSTLCDFFRELENASSKTLNLLQALSKDGPGESHVTEDVFDILIELLTERSKLRMSWHERYRDPIFGDIPDDERPFPCPCLDRKKEADGQMPENLDAIVSQLRLWRLAFVAVQNGDEPETVGYAQGKKKSKKSKSGSLTKKESKRQASNWEKLKANLK